MLAWTEVLAPVLISWPVVALLIVLLFRPHLHRILDAFQNAPGSKAEIGPIKVELGKLAEEGKDAVERLRQITEVMAQSRQLELEITAQMFGPMLSEEQRERMQRHIEMLRSIASQPV